MYTQQVYGYSQQQQAQQQQAQQQQQQTSQEQITSQGPTQTQSQQSSPQNQPKQQPYPYNQPYSPISNNRNLPNFNTYMSSQSHHSPTATPKTVKVPQSTNTNSPHLNYKKDHSLLLQQYSYQNENNDNQQPTNYSSIKPKTNSPHNSPQQPQPAQHYSNPNNHNFTSQDIVTGLTQPAVSYNPSNNSGGRAIHTNSGANNNNENNSELPTLPPLNTSSPQLKGNHNDMNKPNERWLPEEDKLNRKPNTNSIIPPQQPPAQHGDSSVLMQYQNVGNGDRRLMSPYPQHQVPRQHVQQMMPAHPQTMYAGSNANGEEIGPYGCGVMSCFASFSSSNGLFYHMKNVHPNVEEIYKPYRCAMPTCPKRYKNINGLQYHLREAKGSSGHGHLTGEEHVNVKAFQCQIPGCKKAYRTPNGLRYHQQHGHSIQPQVQQQQQQQQPQQPMLDMQQIHAQMPLLQSLQQQHVQQVMNQQIHAQAQQAAQHVQQVQNHGQPAQHQLPQFRLQRDKWLLNNNI